MRLFLLNIICCYIITGVSSCSKPGNGDGTSLPPSAPTLTITPGTSISIPFNGVASFSWTTNGTGVTVNGVPYPLGTFTSPPLQVNTVYTVISYSPNYVTNGLSTTQQVVVMVAPSFAPSLTITPGTSINISFNGVASFSWTTNGTGVTVNGVPYPLGTFTSPPLQVNTVYTVISYSPNYATDGLSTTLQVVVMVAPNPIMTDIYCAGFDNGFIVYWKNDSQYILAPTTYYNGRANGIALSDTNVYVVGHHLATAVYWKNGIQINLVNGRSVTEAKAIAISGTDIYIGGYDVSPVGNLAVYWKNGTEVVLATSGPLTGVNCIAVAGGNVYAAGFIGDSAVFWNNGVRTTLSNGYARANGIAVSGTDIYITGTENGNAVYWKNGARTILPGIAVATGNAIAVSGGDVYVAGIDNTNNACYWKNGVKTVFSTQNSSAKSICLYGGDVYISGWLLSSAVYWKNGIKIALPPNSAPPGAFLEASSILVVPH